MKQLKEELSNSGASLAAPEVDANQLSGMRRLHVLHSRAMKSLKPEIQETKASEPKPKRDLASIDKGRPKVPSPKPKSNYEWKLLVEDEEGGLFGLSRTVTILVFLGGGILIILLSYVIYKYFSWKPRMVARKGYKAVVRSKGLNVNDSDDAAGQSSSPTVSNRAAAPGLIVASK